jgi:hypothetical protein
MEVNIDTLTDDIVDNIMGDKDFTDFGNDSENSSNLDQSDGNSSAGFVDSSQVFNDNNELIGFQCSRVMENNPSLVDIPLLFYIDMKFPKGSESVAKRRVQTELLMAIARDFRITTGKACTDPPQNGISWLVSIKSDTEQLQEDDTFPECRELEFVEATEDCFVYSFELTGNVLTGKTMPDVEAVIESLFVNQVETTLGSDFGVNFLGIPEYEDGAGDKTLNIPPSNLEGSEQGNNPMNRQTITIVGGFLVAAFCLATAGILLVLYRRRKITQLKEQELERSPKQHFSHDTEDEDYDNEVPDQHLHALDLGNSFNQQVLAAHTPNNPNTNNPANRGPAKYLTNVNPNQGPYSHFYGQQAAAGTHRRIHSNQSDLMSQSTVDSWAQTNATIGSLELQMEPITGEI